MENQPATPKAIEHRFHLPIADEDSLREFVRLAWGVEIPDVQVCPDHTTPWRAFCDAYFARHRVTVWEASRGLGGKSFLLAVLALTEAVTLKCDVNVLGGSGEQSANVLKYARQFWGHEGAPRQLLQSDIQRETRLAWGNTIKSLMASQTSVRGPHIPRLRLDECIAGSAGVYTLSGVKAMREIRTGDVVYGWNTCNITQGVVSCVRYTGVRPTLAIGLSNGRTLVCTSNHEVLTDGGWKKAKECKAGDILQGLSSATFKAYAKQHDRNVHNLLEQIQVRACAQMRRLREAIGQSRESLVQRLLEQAQRCTKKLLHRLWCGNSASINALHSLQFQVQSIEKTALHRLWEKVESAGHKAMPQMLAEGVVEDRRHGADGRSQSYGYKSQKRILESRTTMQRIAGLVWVGMGYTGADESVDSGLYSGKPQAGDRGSRSVLARPAENSRARLTKKSVSRGSGIPGAFPSHRQNASLDAISVEGIGVLAVSDGPVMGVWDITVEGLHSFIVEGVIVHNCDEMTLPIFDAAMGQPMSTDTVPAQTVISSTHHNADGTFTEVKRRAADKGWKIYSWGYQETMTGWLSPAEVEAKRQDVTAAQWAVEFDLAEPSPESRAILPEAVAAMFRADLGQYAGGNGEYIEIEPPLAKCLNCGLLAEFGNECPHCHSRNVEPIPYATGADWARKVDHTVIPTARLDVHPARVVAFERCGRLPWPVMVAKFDARLARYGGRACHDETGLGDVVDGYLEHDAEGFIMVGRARSSLLSNYISAVERGEIESPDITFMRNEHKYASVDDVYGSGHLPDSISAMALLWHAVGGVQPTPLLVRQSAAQATASKWSSGERGGSRWRRSR